MTLLQCCATAGRQSGAGRPGCRGAHPLSAKLDRRSTQLNVRSKSISPTARAVQADGRRAIEYLVDRGLLVRRRGVGTQVVHPKYSAR